MKKLLIFVLIAMCLAAALAGCNQKTEEDRSETIEDATTDTPSAEGSENEASQNDQAAEEQTISGIINRLGDFLVLLDDKGAYHVFDFGENVDPAGLEEGETITVTYTGTLDSEDPVPVAVSIEK